MVRTTPDGTLQRSGAESDGSIFVGSNVTTSFGWKEEAKSLADSTDAI